MKAESINIDHKAAAKLLDAAHTICRIAGRIREPDSYFLSPADCMLLMPRRHRSDKQHRDEFDRIRRRAWWIDQRYVDGSSHLHCAGWIELVRRLRLALDMRGLGEDRTLKALTILEAEKLKAGAAGPAHSIPIPGSSKRSAKFQRKSANLKTGLREVFQLAGTP